MTPALPTSAPGADRAARREDLSCPPRRSLLSRLVLQGRSPGPAPDREDPNRGSQDGAAALTTKVTGHTGWLPARAPRCSRSGAALAGPPAQVCRAGCKHKGAAFPRWPGHPMSQLQLLPKAARGRGSGPRCWAQPSTAQRPEQGPGWARRPLTHTPALDRQLACVSAWPSKGWRSTCYFEARGAALRRSVSPGAGRGEEGRTFRANVNFLHQIF